jgi:hypothetical protein
MIKIDTLEVIAKFDDRKLKYTSNKSVNIRERAKLYFLASIWIHNFEKVSNSSFR